MITVQDLTFTYSRSSKPAVRGLSFSIQQGEIFGFLGPSGAGKSTTQKILIGLLKKYQGQVMVFDRPLSTWHSDYYERIGVSFESPNHFLKLSALENLSYFAALYNRLAYTPQQLLEMVGLEEDGNTPVGQFSKGMKNRLNVARALLHNPDLLFFDEPTSGLDPINARRVKDLILAQKQANKTIFLTTHNMSVADELCDRVAFLVDGEIKLIATPRQLKLEHGQPRVRVEFGADGRAEAHDFALDHLGENQDFLALLRSAPIQTIHTLEATLEEVFIQVTGRTLA